MFEVADASIVSIAVSEQRQSISAARHCGVPLAICVYDLILMTFVPSEISD